MPIDMTLPEEFLARPLIGVSSSGPRAIALKFGPTGGEEPQKILSWISQEMSAQTSGKGLTRILLRTRMPCVVPADRQCCCANPTADELVTSAKDEISVHLVVTLPKSASDKRVVGINRLALSACIQATSSLLGEAFGNLIPIHTGVDIYRFKRMLVDAGFGIDSEEDWEMINSWSDLKAYMVARYENTPGASDMLDFVKSAIDGFVAGSSSQQQAASIADTADGGVEIVGKTDDATDLLSYLALGIDILEPIKALKTTGGSFVRPNPNQTLQTVLTTISKMVEISAL